MNFRTHTFKNISKQIGFALFITPFCFTSSWAITENQKEFFEEVTSTQTIFLKDKNGNKRVPYSSSYLSMKNGPLNNPDALVKINDAFPIVNRSEESDELSTLDKFFALRRNILGKKDRENEIRKPFIANEKKPGWTGYCDRWSAAALNAENYELDRNIQGVLCNGIHISRGEMRELLNAFYAANTLPLFGGEGRRNNSPLSPYKVQIKNALGLSDLPPHRLSDQILGNLKNNRGIVLDIDPGNEVWNQPVYQATQTKQILTSPYELALFVDKIPASALAGTSWETNQLLAQLKETDLKLLELSNALDSSLQYYELPQLYQETQRLLSQRNNLSYYVKQYTQQGQIKPAFGTTIEAEKLNVRYSVEGDFAATTNYYGEGNFYSVAIKFMGVTTQSVWLNPEASGHDTEEFRPDFIWFPHNQENHHGFLSGASEELKDLVNILQSNDCKNLNDITRINDLLSAWEDSNISLQDKQELIALYQENRSHIIKSDFIELIKRYNVKGIYYQDLD